MHTLQPHLLVLQSRFKPAHLRVALVLSISLLLIGLTSVCQAQQASPNRSLTLEQTWSFPKPTTPSDEIDLRRSQQSSDFDDLIATGQSQFSRHNEPAAESINVSDTLTPRANILAGARAEQNVAPVRTAAYVVNVQDSGASGSAQQTPPANVQSTTPPADSTNATTSSNSAGSTNKEPAAKNNNVDAPLSTEILESRKQQWLSDRELDQALKDTLVKSYDSILAELKTRAENEKVAKESTTKAEAAPGLIAEAKLKKQNPPKYEAISPFTLRNARQENLQSMLQQQQTAMQQAIDAKNSIDEKIKSRESWKKEFPKLIAEQKAIQVKLNEELSAKGNAEADPRVAEAASLLTRAKLAASVERVRMLEQQLRLYEAEAELLPLQRDMFAGEEKYYAGQIKEINAELTSRRETYIESFDAYATEVLKSSPTESQRVIAQNIIRRVESWLDMARTNRSMQLEAEKSLNQRKFWDERFNNMKNRMQTSGEQGFGGLNSWVGLMLRRQRLELPNSRRLREELADHQAMMQQINSLLLELDDLKSRNAALASSELDPPDELRQKEIQLISDYRIDAGNYFDTLADVAERKQQLIRIIDEFRAFVDQHVLWIRSTEPINKSHFAQLWPALSWLFNYQSWTSILQALLLELRLHLTEAIVVVVLWIFLIYNSVRFRRKITELGEIANRGNNTKYAYTFRVVILTLLIAMPWPALLAYFGLRLYSAAGVQPFVQQFGFGLAYGARFFFAIEVLRQVCRTGGLAEKHLQWPNAANALIRKHLRWFIDIATPLVIVVAMLFDAGDELWENSLGRIAFVALMVLCSVATIGLMHPKRGVLCDYLYQHQGGWVDRLRYIWFAVLVTAPFLLGIGSLFGYHYTSVRLALLVYRTAITLVGIFILYGLAKHWLLLSRRRLAIAQAKIRLEEAQRTSAIAASGNAPVNDVRSTEFRNEIRNEQKALDLAAINAQTMSLVSACAVVAALVSIVWIWTDVLPAVNALDSVKLWQIDNSVTTSTETTSPTDLVLPSSTTTQVSTTWITLSDLLFAIPIGVLTVFAARNLPGLLEIALLQHLPIENAARYAITTVSRYALLMIGIALTFNYMGVRWSSIQWLVAALGVGLGFGLQEIFANFISGLILLFEQPIRVGDVITIGDTVGAVAKIRMRATTITNWDRQELVVPNKDLITGRLLNWTLSDSTNRMVISVSVTFASDTQKACDILLQLCQDHPNVLNDPAPTAFFDNIQDSQLVITLRFFLQTLDLRLQTRHDLLTSIHQRFADAGIEFAYPQRDLHLRTIPEALNQYLKASTSPPRNDS